MVSRLDRVKERKFKNIILGCIIIGVLVCTITAYNSVAGAGQKISIEEINPKDITEEKPIEDITISSVGNILFHGDQLRGAKNNGEYNFSPSFEYIKDYIDKDLGIGVLETTFLGRNYSGYPQFITPDSALDSIKETGIDVVNYATNHIIDSGSEGFNRTIDITKEKNLDIIGVRETKNDKKYLIKDVGDYKIGMISYGFETPKKNGVRTINSMTIPSSISGLINTVNYGELNSFYADVEENILDMKNNGAQFIIVGVHWGEEYNTYASNIQKNMANQLSELDIDIILGGHPHVIQPYETIVNSNGEKVFVAYSQGNFLSNQCYERLGDARTEDGIIINFNIGYNENEEVVLKEYEVIPTWVHRKYNSNGLYSHKIIPVQDALNNLEEYNLTETEEVRLNRSLESTTSILGDDILGKKEF